MNYALVIAIRQITSLGESAGDYLDLRRADVRDADLRGANLSDAYLRSADFTGAIR